MKKPHRKCMYSRTISLFDKLRNITWTNYRLSTTVRSKSILQIVLIESNANTTCM